MKLGVITDGIDRDLEHALRVMNETGLEYAELQFVWDKEIGDHTPEEIDAMLQVIGVDSLDDLFGTIPKSCCCRLEMNLPGALTEWELNEHMDELASRVAVSPE